MPKTYTHFLQIVKFPKYIDTNIIQNLHYKASKSVLLDFLTYQSCRMKLHFDVGMGIYALFLNSDFKCSTLKHLYGKLFL